MQGVLDEERSWTAPEAEATVRWSQRLRSAAATLVPAALLTAFALIPQPPYGAEPFHDAWRRHLIVGLALTFWAVALVLRRRPPRPTLLSVPLFLLLAALLIADVTNPDPRVGVEPLLDLLSSILVFIALTGTPGLSSASLRRSLMIMALALALTTLHFVWGRWQDWLALIQAVPDSGSSLLPPTVPRVLGVGTNPNILAPLMTLTIPLFLFTVARGRGLSRLIAAAAVLTVQLAVFFTLSRSAWIGEAAGLAVALAGAIVATRSITLRLRRSFVAGVAAAMVVAIAAIVLALTLAGGERPLWLFRPSFSARSDFRTAAIRIIRGHPWLGLGPGRFSLAYPEVSDGDPTGAVHSHNVLLQIGVESGIAGLAAAAVVALAAVVVLWRRWQDGDRDVRLVVACVAGSLASFAVGGMGDALHLFPEVLFVLAALMAVTLRAGRERPGAGDWSAWRDPGIMPRWTARALSLTLLALAILLCAVWLRIDQAHAHYARSIDLASRQRWLQSAAEAQHAGSLDPAMPAYHVQSGMALEMAAQSGRSATAHQLAIAAIEHALALEPRSGVTRLELAVLLQATGRTGEETALFPAIIRDAPRDTLVLLGVGVLQEAVEPLPSLPIYAAALAESPRIADSPFWQATPFRRDHFPEIIQLALARAATEHSSAGSAAVEAIIRAAAGPLPGAAGPLRGSDFISRLQLAAQLEAAGDTTGAEAVLRRAIAERPDDPSARLALGRLRAGKGDVREARRQWLAGAYLGDTASILSLGDSFPAGQVPKRVKSLGEWSLQDVWARQLSLTSQHYRFAYRRQEPWPIILRGDWLNGLPRVFSDMSAAVERWQTPAGPAGGR